MGLTALFVSIVLVGTYLLGFQLLGCVIFTTRNSALLWSRHYMLLAIVATCTALAWLLLRRAARRYEAKQASDQMLTLDSWWLLVNALQILFQMWQFGDREFPVSSGVRWLHVCVAPEPAASWSDKAVGEVAVYAAACMRTAALRPV